MLTPAQHANLVRRLLRKGGEINEQLVELLAGKRVDVEALLGHGTPGETPAERLRRFLDLIDERLHAVRAGRYGSCVRCGAEIPFAELDAIPWQTSCRHCALDEAHA